MYIAADGDIGIGTTGPSAKLDIAGGVNINKGVSSGKALSVNGTTAIEYNGTDFSWGSGAIFNYFGSALGIKTISLSNYELVVNGQAAKTGGGSWSNYSDIRLKDVTGNYDKGLDEIIQLQPVMFRYKENNPRDLPSDIDQIGFVAQEVQKIFPEAVNEDADGYLDFNIHSINVSMVNAVKELKVENERINAENEELKAICGQLNARLEKIEAYLNATAEK
jgi:hypothetical protein